MRGLICAADPAGTIAVYEQYLRHTARVLARLRPLGLPPAVFGPLATATKAFLEAARADRTTVARALGEPTIAARVHLLAGGGDGHGSLSRLALAQALATQLEQCVQGKPAFERRHLPSSGLALALADDNPLADIEAHPGKSGNALDWGDKSPDDWAAAIDNAYEVIAQYLGSVAREMQLMLRVVVPVGTFEETHLSASYREAIGAIYVSLHPQQLTMVEALIHEFQHNKLNAAGHLDPLLHNAQAPLFRSPIRPDARPLYGILLAAHAFVPVAELYARLIEADHPWSRSSSFDRRFEGIVAKNADAIATLRQHAETTDAGAVLLDELAARHESIQRGGF